MEGRGIAGRRHLEERGIEALEMEGAPARRPVAHDQVTPQLAYLVQGASEWGEWEGGRKGGRKGERAGGNMDARAIEGFIGATSAITANVQDLSSFLCPWGRPGGPASAPLSSRGPEPRMLPVSSPLHAAPRQSLRPQRLDRGGGRLSTLGRTRHQSSLSSLSLPKPPPPPCRCPPRGCLRSPSPPLSPSPAPASSSCQHVVGAPVVMVAAPVRCPSRRCPSARLAPANIARAYRVGA